MSGAAGRASRASAVVSRAVFRVWRLLKGTGVEAPAGREPQFIVWFLGVPLISWFLAGCVVMGLLFAHAESVVAPLVLGVTSLNIAVTCRVLYTQGELLRRLQAELEAAADAPPPIRAVHEAWRARSAAWGYLASLVTLTFLSAIRFIPSWAFADLFPTNLVPLYELAVLALTVTMIAVLSHYTSRTAAADARATTRELRKLTTGIVAQAQATSAQLTIDLGGLTARLSESLAQTTRETNTVLAGLTDSIRDLAASAAAQTEIVERAQAATEDALGRAATASEGHADALRQLERNRADETAAEVERLRPRIALRIRVAGVLFHHVWLDLYDAASQAVGVVAEIRGGTSEVTLNIGNLPSRLPRAVDIGDVTNFPTDGVLHVMLIYSDLAGRQYRARHAFQFVRYLTAINTTAGWDVTPSGWARAESVLDIPAELERPSLS